jgi:simple sugar transport system ATP-binding protein
MAVLLISAELEEVLSLSDRVAVMFQGRIAAILDVADATPELLGYIMATGKLPEPEAAPWPTA